MFVCFHLSVLSVQFLFLFFSVILICYLLFFLFFSATIFFYPMFFSILFFPMMLVKCIYLLNKICFSVLLLASELLGLQINFIIIIGILVIKLQLSSYKFLGSFYETKLKTTLIDGTVLIRCENCFF